MFCKGHLLIVGEERWDVLKGERHSEGGREEADTRDGGSGSFEVSLTQRSHPVISLGCGLGVLPLVICHPLKC